MIRVPNRTYISSESNYHTVCVIQKSNYSVLRLISVMYIYYLVDCCFSYCYSLYLSSNVDIETLALKKWYILYTDLGVYQAIRETPSIPDKCNTVKQRVHHIRSSLYLFV